MGKIFTFREGKGHTFSQGILTGGAVVQPPANTAPQTFAASQTTPYQTAYSGTLSASDADGDTLTYAAVTQPADGTLALNAATGAFTYTPDNGHSGADSFTWRANDGQADSPTRTVTITTQVGVNTRPTTTPATYDFLFRPAGFTYTDAVRINLRGDDADGDTLTYTTVGGPYDGDLVPASGEPAGVYDYTPDEGYIGDDFFFFRVNDGTINSLSSRVDLKLTYPTDDLLAAHDFTDDTTLWANDLRTVLAAPGGDVALVDDIYIKPLGSGSSPPTYPWDQTTASWRPSRSATGVFTNGIDEWLRGDAMSWALHDARPNPGEALSGSAYCVILAYNYVDGDEAVLAFHRNTSNLVMIFEEGAGWRLYGASDPSGGSATAGDDVVLTMSDPGTGQNRTWVDGALLWQTSLPSNATVYTPESEAAGGRFSLAQEWDAGPSNHNEMTLYRDLIYKRDPTDYIRAQAEAWCAAGAP